MCALMVVEVEIGGRINGKWDRFSVHSLKCSGNEKSSLWGLGAGKDFGLFFFLCAALDKHKGNLGTRPGALEDFCFHISFFFAFLMFSFLLCPFFYHLI